MLEVVRGLRGTTALGIVLVTVVAGQAAGQEPVTTPGGTIEGTIYDSLLTRGPLKGATVYIVGTNHVVTSDVRGRFSIARVPDGDYSLTFAHVAFDSAGVQAPVVAVRVTSPATARVIIATPAGASLVKAACPGPRAEASGLLLGVVRDVDTAAPLAGARVFSRWFELSIDKKGPQYQTLETSAVSDQSGVYRLCGVPADIPVFVRAQAGTQETGRVEVDFSGAEVAFRDFAVSLVDTAAQVVPDSLLERSADSTALVGRGTSMLRGVVRDDNGRPVPNARVGLLDGGRSVTTSSDGRFALANATAGTQTLELRAIGFEPTRRTVVLKSNAPTETDTITLGRTAQKLASIRVLGTRKDGRLTRFGFDERRRHGLGFFLNAEEIQSKSGIYLGDVLRFAPGVTTEYTRRGRVFTMRSTANGDRCSPAYFLDGMRWYALEGSPILELERFLTLRDVAGVEVYRSGSGMPMQFDTGSGCGSIAFWTK